MDVVYYWVWFLINTVTREDDGASSEWVEKKRKKDDDSILTKTGGCGYYCNLCLLINVGGAYIPPARLRIMQAQITDKTRYGKLYFKLLFIFYYYSLFLFSVPYQRMAWEALKKSINGLINKVRTIT